MRAAIPRLIIVYYKMKKIVVKPGKRLSLQKHFKRNEHWVVVEGEALVTIDASEMQIK